MKRTPSNPSLPQSLPQSSPQSSAASKAPIRPPKSKSPGSTAAKKPKASTSKGTLRSPKAASAHVAAADPSRSSEGSGSATDVDVAQVIAPVASTEAVTPPQPLSTPCGSKRAQLVSLLQSPAGASMAQMMALTGWQSHTVRGLISGTLRKRLGLTVQLEVSEGQRVYRIVEGVQP